MRNCPDFLASYAFSYPRMTPKTATVLSFPPDGAGFQRCRIQDRHVMTSTVKHRGDGWNTKVQVRPEKGATVVMVFFGENVLKLEDLAGWHSRHGICL